MAAPIKIVGAPGSPYSRKLRAVLRFRRIPHVWVQSGSRRDEGELPELRVRLLPIAVFAGDDGAHDEAVVDSTPLIRRLERDYQERSIIPPDPAAAFLDALIEDYADEWLTKCMFHYRWAFQADIDFASSVLPRWSSIDADDEQIAPLSRAFADRQIERLWVVGSNETTAPVIEASYRRLLEVFNHCLSNSPYLFGGRPAACDFALFGQLTQLVQFDPTPMAVARAAAPRIVAWVDVVEDLSGAVVDDDDWRELRDVAGSLRALLAEIGRVYAPFLIANAEAVAAGRERVECQIDGRPWVQRPFPYQAKCLRVLGESYAQLSASARADVDAALSGSGCERLFA